MVYSASYNGKIMNQILEDAEIKRVSFDGEQWTGSQWDSWESVSIVADFESTDQESIDFLEEQNLRVIAERVTRKAVKDVYPKLFRLCEGKYRIVINIVEYPKYTF